MTFLCFYYKKINIEINSKRHGFFLNSSFFLNLKFDISHKVSFSLNTLVNFLCKNKVVNYEYKLRYKCYEIILKN